MSDAALSPGSSPFFVSLLFREPHPIDLDGLNEALSERAPGVVLSTRDENGTIAIRHAQTVEFEEGELPASLALTEGPAPSLALVHFAHSFHWREGRELAGAPLYAITLGEMTTVALPIGDRTQLLLETIIGLVESHRPVALHWPDLQRLDSPDGFLAAAEDDRLGQLVNVRMFRVAGSNDLVMDTLGLCALGLLDLQIHFRGLEPDDVATRLHELAAWLMVGAIIKDQSAWLEDGDTTPGLDDTEWRCRFEMSMNGPTRGVVDLEPPAPFSARE